MYFKRETEILRPEAWKPTIYATFFRLFAINFFRLFLTITWKSNKEVVGQFSDRKLCDISQNAMGRSSTTVYFLVAVITLYSKLLIFLRKRSRNAMMHKMAAMSKSKAVRMLVITVFGYVLSLSSTVVLTMLRSYGVLNETLFGAMLLEGRHCDIFKLTGKSVNLRIL